MEPIITSKLPKEKFSKVCHYLCEAIVGAIGVLPVPNAHYFLYLPTLKPCYVCEEAGLETQATHGACMYCHKSSCRLAFHVTWYVVCGHTA